MSDKIRRPFQVIAVAAAYAGLALTPVQAADEWSGFYFGAQAGHQWTNVFFTDPVPPDISGDYDVDGLVIGGHAGYNFRDGPIVIGAEADIEYADGDGSSIGTGPVAVEGTGEIKWQGSVRARLGYAMDRFLVYGTAGVAFGEFEFGFNFPVGGPALDNFSETMVGITAGGGVEFAVTESISVGAEYRYTDWGKADGSIVNCCAGPPDLQRHEPVSHAVRARVSFHLGPLFGGP